MSRDLNRALNALMKPMHPADACWTLLRAAALYAMDAGISMEVLKGMLDTALSVHGELKRHADGTVEP